MAEFFIYKDRGIWRNVKEWKKYLESLPEGKYKVVIEPSDKRSLQQNAWFHSVLPDILKGLRDVGYNDVRTLDDAKDFVKSMFFKKSFTNGSEVVEVIEGTSKQSKINFAEKAEDIIIWAQQYLGIDVAPPDKQLELM